MQWERIFDKISSNSNFYLQIFETYSNAKFRENPSSGNQVVPRGKSARGTGILDESNSCFPQFCQRTPK
jgi:hypothetical protein